MEDNYEHFEIPLLHNIYANPQPSSAPTIARELYTNPEATPSRLRHEFLYANPQATPTCVTTSAVLASSSSASDLEPRNLITVWTDDARPIQGELLDTLMYRLRERCPGHRCWIDPINNKLWALANTEPQARQFVRNTHSVGVLNRTVILQSSQTKLSDWPHGSFPEVWRDLPVPFPEVWRDLPVRGVGKGKGKGVGVGKGKGMGQYWTPSWPSRAPGTGRSAWTPSWAHPATPFVVVPTLNTSIHLKPLPHHKSRPPVAPPEVQASPLNLHMWELGFRGPFTAPFTAPLRPRPPHCKFPPVPPPRPPLMPPPWNN